MKRSEVLAGLPPLVAASLGVAGGLWPRLGLGQTPTPCPSPTVDPCAHWQFPSIALPKGGGQGYAEAQHRPDCGAWSVVGGVYLDIIINKGGGFTRDNMTFTDYLGNRSQTFLLTELPATFHANSLVQIFKNWWFQVDGTGRGGTLYQNGQPGSGGVAVGYGTTDAQFQSSSFTMIPVNGGSAGSCTVPWGQGPLVLPGDLGICIAASAAWAATAVILMATLIGGIAGPAEWIVFAGVCIGFVGLSQLVLENCK